MVLRRSFLTVFLWILVINGCICQGEPAQNPVSMQDLTFLTEDFYPYNYQENGTPGGLAVDLLVAITKEAGDEIPATAVRIVPLNEGLNQTKTNPSTVIFSIARTPQREDSYEWVGPFASYNIVLFARTSRHIRIQSEKDLTNYMIGATTADVSVEKLKQLGVSPDHIVTDPDPLVLLKMIDEGTIDLVTSGDIAGEYFIQKAGGLPGEYTIAYLLEATPLYYAFNRDTPPQVVTAFREALDRLYLSPAEGGMSRYNETVSAWDPTAGLTALTYYTEEYYPYNFMDNETITGISVDLLHEILSRLNAEISPDHLSIGTWDTQYQTVLNQTGSVLFSTARSPEREELFLWAGPVFQSTNVIFACSPQGDTIQPDDILTMRLGAVTDDIGGIDLKEAGVQDIVYATDASELIQALENGDIDGWAYAELPGREMIKKYASDPGLIRPVYTLKTRDFYYAFNRNTPENLVWVVQHVLDQIKEPDPDGISTYDQIVARYTRG